MKQQKPLLKNIIIFMLVFIFLSFIAMFAFMLAIVFLPDDLMAYQLIPGQDTIINVAEYNWQKLDELGGYGQVLNEAGQVVAAYNIDSLGQVLQTQDLLTLINGRDPDYTHLAYLTGEGNTLVLSFPSEIVSAMATVYANALPNYWQTILPYALLFIILLYLFMVYLLVRALNKRLYKQLALMQAEENQRKDDLFRGLAHDLKTPLAGIMAYTAALEDGMVGKDQVMDYYQGIRRNSLILQDRVQDMVKLASLSDPDLYQPVRADLLESIRRYVGENYSWYLNRQAQIKLNFEENDHIIIDHDPKLLNRLLENLLQNSVHHNPGPVTITINLLADKSGLVVSDNGVGVPAEIQDRLFEPLVTGEASRTGDQLRGWGLANVARIAGLHGWQVDYTDEGFVVKFKRK